MTTSPQSISYLGCSHYPRKCKIQAPCCPGKWFGCRFCHNEEISNHEIDRHSIHKVKCMNCENEQEPQKSCDNCGIEFAQYFCSVCKYYNDNSDAEFFHCDGCGICRVGKREDYFHCDTCEACLSISMKDSHKCLEKKLHQDCPICLEYMFTSREPTIFMNCGHAIHEKCYQNLIEQNHYRCPYCNKSIARLNTEAIDEMVNSMEMPEEYRNQKTHILCNDCEAKNEVHFNLIAHKCPECGSYNTSEI